MSTTKNALSKPLLRGHSHQAAFFMALGACAMLMGQAQDVRHFIPALIYSFSLIALFGISALYHRPNWNPKQRMFMKRLDHAAIYILIAGTSTPICLLKLPMDTGIKLMELVWGAAFLGIFQSLFWANAPKWLSSILYVTAGLLVLPYRAELSDVLSTKDLIFLYSGGVVYITGAVIYALKKPNPFPKIFGYHEIFHLLVIVGASLHFLVISKLVH